MFRDRIVLNERSDVESLLAGLEGRLEGSRLDPATRALATAEARAIAGQFVSDGRRLAALGSQFNARREMKGAGYSIDISFRPQASRGWLAKLLGR